MHKQKKHRSLRTEEEARRRFEKALKELDKKLKPLLDAIRESQILTAKDYGITINAR